MSSTGHTKLPLSTLQNGGAVGCSGILLLPPRPPAKGGGSPGLKRTGRAYGGLEKACSPSPPRHPRASYVPRRSAVSMGTLRKHFINSVFAEIKDVKEGKGSPSSNSNDSPGARASHSSKRHSGGFMGPAHESPHEAVVKERRISLEKMEKMAMREIYEKNEEYRERVRKVGSDRSLTKLMDADAERRENLWVSIIHSMKSVEAMATIVKERRALATLQQLLLPICWKWVKALEQTRKRAKLIEERVEHMQKPTVASLKAIKFFQNWPNYILSRLVDGMEPACYRQDEFVCMEGDIGDRMYIIAKGELDIYVRKENAPGKSRAAGVKVANISSTSQPYFGEYAVVCKEPRFASVRAATPYVDLWAVSSAFVSLQLDELPIDVRRDIANFAGGRRQANLRKLYPIKASMLAQSGPIFRVFDEALLQELVRQFVPVVVRSPSVIYHQGEVSDKMYLVATGEVELSRDRHDEVITVRQGKAFGEAELLFVEKRGYTASTKGPADLWALGKIEFMQFLLTHPELFMAAKDIISKNRSMTAISCSNQPWLRDPLLTKYLPLRLLRKLSSILVPKVVGRADYVAQNNEEFEGIYVIASGGVRDEKTQAIYTEDSLLGRAELLTFQPRWSASLVAIERCDLWFISKNRIFAEVMNHHKEMLQKLSEDAVQEKIRRQYMQPYQPPEVYRALVRQLEDGSPYVSKRFATNSNFNFAPSFRSDSIISAKLKTETSFALTDEGSIPASPSAQTNPQKLDFMLEGSVIDVESEDSSSEVGASPILEHLLGSC